MESATPNASAGAPPGTGIELLDTEHLGRPGLIGAWFAGDVLVDPGPSTSIGRLTEAIERRRPRVRVLALTHIHLDHAGAAGSLARRFPALEVWVHERGAPHLIDPSKLLASARRLYGDEMDALWGEVLPVPAERVRVLQGGERIDGMRVAYTPGHASHHVAYLHEASGIAFAGDAAGVRLEDGPVILPTPPPDIDLDAWSLSLDAIAAWGPQLLALTHFGSFSGVDEHLDAMREALTRARTDAQLDEVAFRRLQRARVTARGAGEDLAGRYQRVSPPANSHAGLARWRSKQ